MKSCQRFTEGLHYKGGVLYLNYCSVPMGINAHQQVAATSVTVLANIPLMA